MLLWKNLENTLFRPLVNKILPLIIAGAISLTTVNCASQTPQFLNSQPNPPSEGQTIPEAKSPTPATPEEEYDSYVAKLIDKTFSQYALDTKIGFYLPKEMRNNFLAEPEKYKEDAKVCMLVEIEKLNPALAKELVKISDYYKSNFNVQTSVDDVKILGYWYEVEKNNRYMDVFGTSIQSILDNGMPEKRIICTGVEAGNWTFKDVTPDFLSKNKPWKNYFKTPQVVINRGQTDADFWGLGDINLMRFLAYSWDKSSTSKNYQSEEWWDQSNDPAKLAEIFDKKVVPRLNSPEALRVYKFSQIKNVDDLQDYWQNASETFIKKSGDCEDHGIFVGYCLKKNGYNAGIFRVGRKFFTHAVAYFNGDGKNLLADKIYYYDYDRLYGPFDTSRDAAIYLAEKGNYPFEIFTTYIIDLNTKKAQKDY